MEHRWGERVQVNLPIRVSAHAFSVRGGRMTDLSVSGAYITADMDIRLLSRIQIAIVLPQRWKHEAPAVSAFVTRKYRHGIGIEWCEFSPAPVSRLLSIAASHPYGYVRKPTANAALTISRISGTLLKHGK